MNDMQDWIKISSRISLLFESKGTKQRGSANYCSMPPPGCLSFSGGSQFGDRGSESVCVPIDWEKTQSVNVTKGEEMRKGVNI